MRWDELQYYFGPLFRFYSLHYYVIDQAFIRYFNQHVKRSRNSNLRYMLTFSVFFFRPLHLPLRAFVTIGNFSMSSNLVAQTRTNTLRIITEDCALLLSNKCKKLQVQLCDYVCVIELGLFELSLRYSDKVSCFFFF